MKILFVCSSRKGAGVSPFIKTQADSLKSKGIQLDFFIIKGSGFKAYLINLISLHSVIKKQKPNIIHAHFGFCGIISLLSGGNNKVIVSYMGDDLLGTPDLKGKYSFKSKIFSSINVFFSFFYNSVIVKSAEMKDKLPYRKVHIIPNGVNFNNFYPVNQITARLELKLLTDKVYLLFAGSPKQPRKNFALAQKTMFLLENRNIELLVLENIPHEKVFLYYNAVNVLLLLSLHEGSPNVIKEAMACNCPIVSTDVGDVKEVIGKTDGCYLCSYDPKDVSEKILKAIEFGKRTNGREMIDNLELGIIADRILKIYESLLKK